MAGQGQIDVYTSRGATGPHDGSESAARPGCALSEATGKLRSPWRGLHWNHPGACVRLAAWCPQHPLTALRSTPLAT